MPKFNSLIGYWPSIGNGEVYEFYTNNCSDLWCHQLNCIGDPYYESQTKQVEKIEPKIKALLDEYEAGKLYNQESLERFKQYMEDNDLINLLPGVVPGFALRNRRWGVCPLFESDWRVEADVVT